MYYADSYDIQNDNHSAIINATIPLDENGQFSKCYIYADVFDYNYTRSDDDESKNSILYKLSAAAAAADDDDDNDDGDDDDNYEDTNERKKMKCDKWVYDTAVFESTVATEVCWSILGSNRCRIVG